MAEIIILTQATNDWRGWVRRINPKTRIRIGLAALLIVSVVLFCLYRPRHAAIAVAMVGGVTSSADPLHTANTPKSDSSLPSIAFPLWQWAQANISPYLSLDDHIFGVNLANADVDHRWLSRLKPMSSLEILSLEQKQIGAEFSALSGLPKLREVRVTNVSADTDLEHLLKLPHLQRIQLVIRDGSARGIAALGTHPSLQKLDLEALGNNARAGSDFIEQCESWCSIQTISIRSKHSLMPGLATLRACQALRTLEVSSPLQTSDVEAISQIKQLTSLVVNARNVANNDWLMLKQLQNLRTLKIYSEGTGPSPIAELRSALVDCEIEVGP